MAFLLIGYRGARAYLRKLSLPCLLLVGTVLDVLCWRTPEQLVRYLKRTPRETGV